MESQLLFLFGKKGVSIESFPINYSISNNCWPDLPYIYVILKNSCLVWQYCLFRQKGGNTITCSYRHVRLIITCLLFFLIDHYSTQLLEFLPFLLDFSHNSWSAKTKQNKKKTKNKNKLLLDVQKSECVIQ